MDALLCFMKTIDMELEYCARVVDWTCVALSYCNNKKTSVLVGIRLEKEIL